METGLRDHFLLLWKKYFGDEELPITFFYSDGNGGTEIAAKPAGRSCLICELKKVRSGKSMAFNAEAVTCNGGKRYLGFSNKMRPGFDYFLSCGNESIEGERYIRTPEMVNELMKNIPSLSMEGKNIVFKRWDNLEANDNPDVVIFFC
jgi:uncharacterized protein (DUF169 family)